MVTSSLASESGAVMRRILVAGGGDMVLTMRVGDREGPEERYIALTEPEFYQDNIRHPESSWGTMASLRWLDQVITTVIDPLADLEWWRRLVRQYIGHDPAARDHLCRP